MDTLVNNNYDLPSNTEHQDCFSGHKNATIMMVDDEPIMMEILQVFLEEKGYHNFIMIDQSTQALEVLNRENPDVLLLDLIMPKVNGFDILEAVRANPETVHMPVIVLTSSSDDDTKLRALELGATDFLAKPIDSSELALRLRNTLTVKAYQDQLAYYDSLTGLPNRKLFLDRLGWVIKRGRREKKLVSVMNIGLDRFRHINDSLGPKAGDSLLRQVAERLTQVIRESDIVGIVKEEFAGSLARLGGDEFSIVLFEVNQADNAAIVARRILRSFHRSFVVFGQEVFITASIGIAVYPHDGEDTDVLIKHAGAAVIHAKQQGRDNFQFYSKEINAQSRERLNLETSLRRAIERDELELYYQPKIALHDGRIMGMEALLRWNNPERGLVSPAKFIPLAEETGLIVPIGEWVIREACRQNKAWQNHGVGNLKVSVNVSSQQFRHQHLRQVIQSALSESAMDPCWLMVEITESVVMDDAEKTVELLVDIRRHGISFSIDDFGTGYSSLSYLKKLPLDELKIDRSFLLEVPHNQEDAAVTKAIIAIAHGLGLSVVAEGVENNAQLEFLRQQGCDVIQGFLFSKPLPAAQFAAFVKEHDWS
jgi:diguanylate cyclase